MESDYIQMARLKGLKERTVVARHALPNGLAPTIQATAISLAWLAGGVVVIEYLFAFPASAPCTSMRSGVATCR